jgi:hypothetical protein
VTFEWSLESLGSHWTWWMTFRVDVSWLVASIMMAWEPCGAEGRRSANRKARTNAPLITLSEDNGRSLRMA